MNIERKWFHLVNITIFYQSTLITSGKNWGISHVGLYLYRCDPTCLTCSGPSSNQCISCYSLATLLATKKCSCDNPYYADITTNCLRAPCTVCTQCYTGCNSCTDGSATSCTSCQTDFFLYMNEVNFKNY